MRLSDERKSEDDWVAKGLEFDKIGKFEDIQCFDQVLEINPECNKLSKLLNGGLLVRLDIDQKATQADIKKSIEKAAELTSSFKPVKKVALW